MIGLYSANSQAITAEPFSFGNALEFDGTDDFVSHTAYTLGGSGVAFSISIWVKYASATITKGKLLLGNSSSTANFIDCINTGTSIRVRMSSAISEFTIPSITTNWFHLVITKDSSNNVRLYINGVESSTGALTNTGQLSGINNIGRRAISVGDAATYDQYAVWDDYTLSSAEVSTLYNSGNGNFITEVGGTPFLIYELDETGTATTADNTGSGGATYDGTLNNFPTSGMWVAH